jgi:hypothetical protein
MLSRSINSLGYDLIHRATDGIPLALHDKLGELLRVDGAARSELARLDEREPDARHRDMELARASAENRLMYEGVC